MELARLRVRQFRNVEGADLTFPTRVTVLNGDNAQGKTNIVEAISVLASLRSFRTRRVTELVMDGRRQSVVEGEAVSKGFRATLRVEVDRTGKAATLDGRTPNSAQEYLSALHVVLFTPWDLELAFGSQEMRRSYVDRAAFLKSAEHLSLLRRYARLLRHRNALLREPRSDLSVWNEQLAQAGGAIRRARRTVIEEISVVLEKVHREISGGAEEVNFEGGFGGEAGFPDDEFLDKLYSSEEVDRRVGHTTLGPHRDVLHLRLSGKDTRAHASRGQQRTAALSLKIAFLLWATETMGDAPVFVLDDPGSELDTERLSFLGSFLSKWPGQVIIDCTPEANISFSKDVKPMFYRVKAGTVTPWT